MTAPARPRRLFHLAAKPAFEAFLASGGASWAPASLAGEGFVHLSFAEQLAGTLEAHFGGAGELVLLEVELAVPVEGGEGGERGGGAERAEPGLVIEPSRGGADFPHLYRAVRRGELCRAWPLARGADGAWRLPRLGGTAEADRPLGVRPA